MKIIPLKFDSNLALLDSNFIHGLVLPEKD